jgi:hypothetical protein
MSAAPVSRAPDDRPGPDREQALLMAAGQPRAQLRGHAVPDAFPAPGVGQQRAAAGVVQARPELLGDRPHPVDRPAPVTVELMDPVEHQPPHGGRRDRALRQRGRREWGRVGDVSQRQPPVPGDRVHLAVLITDRDVDHG